MKQIFFKQFALFLMLFIFSSTPQLLAQKKELKLVGKNDCGVVDQQPFLIKGDNYTLPKEFTGSKEALTCNFGGLIIYAFDEMDIQADYQLEVVYLADRERIQQIVTDGVVIHGPVTMEAGKEQRYIIDLPKKAFAYGQLVLVFEAMKGGTNVLVSELNIYSSNSTQLKAFTGDSKNALSSTLAYKVDTNVDAEKHLPTYTLFPQKVAGVYNPKMSLNGTWQFNAKAEANFEQRGTDGSNWSSIAVPGQWSMQGFAVDSAGFAAYQKTFNVPKDWSGKRIKIRFDGVSSESIIYLNGKEVGQHMGGMTAFEIDLTHAIREGENRLAVKVRSESLADMLGSLTQYAAHQIGGITRKVTLFAVPDMHISDLRIQTGFDKEYKDSELKTFVKIENTSNISRKNVSVRLSIDGLPVVIETIIPNIAANSAWSGWLTGTVSKPMKWDNEHPNLYTMKINLSDAGQTIEQVEKRFGFREVKVNGNQLLVNGKAVKLRGVCRHEVHPLTGRVLDVEMQIKDVELYRAANCNFIRTSHYPPAEEMLDICDELGMFVEVEAPVCWMGHHANENWKVLNYRDSKYYGYVLQANMETMHFYRNHPSLIFWSMANESYWNKEFAQILEYMKLADPTRPSAFHDQAYGGFNNQGSTTAIANIHYPGPQGYKRVVESNRPMVFGEYCHLNVYNRSELVTDPGVRSDWALALAPMWENMYKTQAVLGGSLWSGIDDVFQLPNGDAVGYGPWGPIDGWRRPKPEYWDMKKIYSPIRVTTSKLEPSNQLVLDIENRYTYININELQINWRYGNQSGNTFANIAPSKSGKIIIDIQQPDASNELYIAFIDPRGFVADEYIIPIGKQSQNELPQLATETTKLKESKDRYTITGSNFTCSISRTTGQIISMQRNKVEILCGGPWLMALPLNGGGCFPNHNAETPLFNDLCSGWEMKSISAQKKGNNIELRVEGSYAEFEGHYTLSINANGEFTTDYSFKSLVDLNPRQWGLVFETPKSFDETFWRRDGLWSVYPDDHISRSVGTAKLFYEGLPATIDPRIEPTWSWSLDFNELGSSDFRSTRRNIWYAGLMNKSGNKVTTRSGGKQSWRSWLDKDKIKFLIADFVTAGNEMFLESHYAPFRKPIKQNDTIYGSITLRIE